MNKIETLKNEVAEAKNEFDRFFDADGNFLTPTTKLDPAFLAAQSKYNSLDKELRKAQSQADYGCSVAVRSEREANGRQLAAIRRLLERDAKNPAIGKSQAQLDAEYDRELERNNS
jgi:hypothetical protein